MCLLLDVCTCTPLLLENICIASFVVVSGVVWMCQFNFLKILHAWEDFVKAFIHDQNGIGCRYININVKDFKMWNWF